MTRQQIEDLWFQCNQDLHAYTAAVIAAQLAASQPAQEPEIAALCATLRDTRKTLAINDPTRLLIADTMERLSQPAQDKPTDQRQRFRETNDAMDSLDVAELCVQQEQRIAELEATNAALLQANRDCMDHFNALRADMSTQSTCAADACKNSPNVNTFAALISKHLGLTPTQADEYAEALALCKAVQEPAQGEQLLTALKAAESHIMAAPHGDNCFLHDDGGEFDSCFCGKDSILSYLNGVLEGDEAQGDAFCDAHCTWRDHHPECKRAEVEPIYCGCGDQIMPDDGARCGTCVAVKYQPAQGERKPAEDSLGYDCKVHGHAVVERCMACSCRELNFS